MNCESLQMYDNTIKEGCFSNIETSPRAVKVAGDSFPCWLVEGTLQHCHGPAQAAATRRPRFSSVSIACADMCEESRRLFSSW